ncbi:MAG: FAD-linked oxidase [Candidatus Muproteobacteria bacterium RBG_16_62_13]|uniref:Delta(24)-sterol reductase n=1 Tax=Candidatus Muproteobacteria bacterium RBG_16_62_13 TaxID=1817756 RepID=A0A1F6SWL9_9PROT|nr:MAG: FAD-linked oxidase [Candidatus Muproteobacteria bacterium RBG_16_62_13]
MSLSAYVARKARLVEFLQRQAAGSIRLGKDTSNLFRDRQDTGAKRLDVRDFNHVLHVDPAAGIVDVEGMTPYAVLVDECLKHGVMPTVVPQLKSITIGGATTGCGIEASSFRYGLVHETVQEIEVLLPGGRVVTVRPDNEHRDLFHGFPNSYGTLGYALRLKVRTVPVKSYVRLTHIRHRDPEACFADMARHCDRADIDFVDGVVFGRDEMVITLGQFVDQAPYTSDYTYDKIFYRSLRERTEDYLTVRDFIWRWDTDWFWCSKNLFAQNPLIRRLVYGRRRLNSIFYTKVMRWNSRWGITARLNRLLGIHSESVIQDVEIPLERCAEFFRFYHDNIRFLPVWLCPTRAYNPAASYDLYRMKPGQLYINFGFWDVISRRQPIPPGHFNRLVEQEVMALGGMKSLYSDSYFTEAEFWSIYNRPRYQALKAKYDPDGRMKDLFRKCVLNE